MEGGFETFMKIDAAVIGMGVGEKHAKIYQENKFVRLKNFEKEKKVKFSKSLSKC